MGKVKEKETTRIPMVICDSRPPGTFSCYSMASPEVATQCLKANSTLANTFTMGQGNGAITVQTWETQGAAGVTRQGFQIVGRYALPVFNTEPQRPGQLNILSSLKTKISDPSMIQIPANCPPKPDVVG